MSIPTAREQEIRRRTSFRASSCIATNPAAWRDRINVSAEDRGMRESWSSFDVLETQSEHQQPLRPICRLRPSPWLEGVRAIVPNPKSSQTWLPASQSIAMSRDMLGPIVVSAALPKMGRRFGLLTPDYLAIIDLFYTQRCQVNFEARFFPHRQRV